MTGAPALSIANIGQVGIRVRDVERATAFYRDVLGLKFLFAAPPGLAFFDCGGVRLMLSKAEAGEFDHASSILYLRVADIQAAHAHLVAKRTVIVKEPHLLAPMPDHDLWLCFFRDGEDNVLALMSEVPRK